MQDATYSVLGRPHDHGSSNDRIYAYVFLDEHGREHVLGTTLPGGGTLAMVSHCRGCMDALHDEAGLAAAAGMTVRFVEFTARTVLHAFGTAGRA